MVTFFMVLIVYKISLIKIYNIFGLGVVWGKPNGTGGKCWTFFLQCDREKLNLNIKTLPVPKTWSKEKILLMAVLPRSLKELNWFAIFRIKFRSNLTIFQYSFFESQSVNVCD